MSGALDGKIVLVTGVTGKAGAAVVQSLHLAGAELIVVGRDRQRLDAFAEHYEPSPQRLVVDLTDRDATEQLVRNIVEQHGRLDGVVHLVGGWTAGGVEDFDPRTAEQLWRSLVVTTANLTTASRSALIASRGRFVAVGSVTVDHPSAQNAVYGAAKSGAEHWVMALADAFEDTGASAFVLRVRALLTPAMQQRDPQRDRTGWTRVDQLAHSVLRNWDLPHTNGIRIIA